MARTTGGVFVAEVVEFFGSVVVVFGGVVVLFVGVVDEVGEFFGSVVGVFDGLVVLFEGVMLLLVLLLVGELFTWSKSKSEFMRMKLSNMIYVVDKNF